MDWSRIKTIFIVAFLVLDIFLVKEFMVKRNAIRLDKLADISIEQQLITNDIKYPTLPKVIEKFTSITGTSREFRISDIQKLTNQKVQVINKTSIVSILQNPIEIKENPKDDDYQKFLDIVYLGNKYVYWKKDKKTNTIYFVQKVKGKYIFNNAEAILMAYMNNKGEIISYKQMYLDILKGTSNEGRQTDIITATKALESLFVNNAIKPNSTVNKVELGYYKLITLNSGIEVLVPTWRFVVNETEEYYVNGMEGQIINLHSGGDNSEKRIFNIKERSKKK